MSDGSTPEITPLRGTEDAGVRSSSPEAPRVHTHQPPDDVRTALDAVRASLGSDEGNDGEKESTPLLWPHESPKQGGRRRPLHVPRRPRIGDYARGPEVVMARLNGKEAVGLEDKYTFIDLVKSMPRGYTVPEQTLVTTGQTSAERVTQVGEHFSDPDQSIICKPHNGRGGIGIIEMPAGKLPEFLSSLSQDYIIQNKVPIKAEVRYVRQVDERGGVIRRIYDEKEIPKVVGDGTKTKGQLIREGKVPWYSKAATTLVNARSLKTVVSQGSAVHLSFFGVPHKEEAELEWGEQKKQRVENMDRFMAQFVADLEETVGTQLPQLCFDIGVKDPSVLDAPYDFDQMKANLVPFESQMPFSLWGYVKRSSKTLGQMYDTARTLYGPILTGKKRDFLTRRESISKETGLRTVEEEHDFGRGEVTVIRVTPESQKVDPQTGEVSAPLVFVHGFGQVGTLKDNLALFAEEGRREVVGVAYMGKRQLKTGSERLNVGDDEVIVPRYQVDQAKDIIAAMDALGIAKASIIGTSEGAIRAAIAVALDQERFDHGILVHPAGMGNDNVLKVAARVMHQFARNAVRKFKERKESREKSHKKSITGNPLQMLAEGWAVAYGSMAQLVPVLGKRLSIAAGEGDVIYTEDRLRSVLDENEVFRLFVTKGEGHGIGQRPETVREVLSVLEEMEQRLKEHEV